MKTVIMGAIICAVAAVVISERCFRPSDCSITLCGNGTKLICERGECTCQSTASKCISQRDCLSGPDCQSGDWHCVDNVCRCY